MTIHIDDLRFPAVIGILETEREHPQEIRIDIEIDYAYREGGYLDYAAIAADVRKHLTGKRYGLLEEALLGVKTLLFERYPPISRLYCRIAKPRILPDCSVALSREWRRDPPKLPPGDF